MLPGSEKVLDILHREEMEQRPVVDSAAEDKLIRLGIAASFRRGDVHEDNW